MYDRRVAPLFLPAKPVLLLERSDPLYRLLPPQPVLACFLTSEPQHPPGTEPLREMPHQPAANENHPPTRTPQHGHPRRPRHTGTSAKCFTELPPVLRTRSKPATTNDAVAYA